MARQQIARSDPAANAATFENRAHCIGNNSIFLDVETRTATASGDPKALRDHAEDPRVRRFLRRGEDGTEAPQHG